MYPRYSHGGRWRSIANTENPNGWRLSLPGIPPIKNLMVCSLRLSFEFSTFYFPLFSSLFLSMSMLLSSQPVLLLSPFFFLLLAFTLLQFAYWICCTQKKYYINCYYLPSVVNKFRSSADCTVPVPSLSNTLNPSMNSSKVGLVFFWNTEW